MQFEQRVTQYFVKTFTNPTIRIIYVGVIIIHYIPLSATLTFHLFVKHQPLIEWKTYQEKTKSTHYMRGIHVIREWAEITMVGGYILAFDCW